MGRNRKFDVSFKEKVVIAALQEKESSTTLAVKCSIPICYYRLA